MRQPCLRALVVLALLAPLGCAMQSEYVDDGPSVTTRHGDPDLSLFYDELDPYGRWFQYGDYGYCWSPYDVSPGWRPYTVGRWAYTDAGWTWMSDEPFGWATYHYGRWTWDMDYGYVWVPEPTWGPAWVAWRYNDDYVGWAPLPPAATWTTSVGLTWSDDLVSRVNEDAWVFVPSRSILDTQVQTRAVPTPRNRWILPRTQVHVMYDANGGRPRNIGLDERFVERWTRRPVPRYRVREETRPRVSRGSGSDVWMYRPVVRETPPSRPPRDVAAPTPAAPDDAEMRTRRAANRRAVEAHWENERRRLEAEQRREDQQPGAGDEKRRRHEEEMRALEEQKQRDVKVMESRQEKNLVRGRKEKKEKKDRGR